MSILSLLNMLERIKVYEMPEALSKYIQDKGRSSFSNLWLLPWIVPVFVMNPTEYQEPLANLPFKEVLQDIQSADGSATKVNSSVVPAGEIWEVTEICGESDGSGNIIIFLKRADAQYHPLARGTTPQAFWNGHIWLQVGDSIELNAAVGNVNVYVLGVKRYA